MLEVLQFIFSGFWIWLGTMCLLWVIVWGGVKLALAFAYAVRGGKITM